ncbi:MAG: TRAP transporter large permease subunit [Pseudolabrys sp.]|nr:TRAP transporter large permease subunit [Pseudolabrys sp.]MDP2297122.1 TRAP transporter large permease subunit [Pseudolabrys sp.]
MAWQAMLLLYAAMLAVLIGVGCPIAVALGLTALAGIFITHGFALLPTVGDIVWNTGNSFTLVAVPMFILMGEIILQTGLSRRFYRGLATLLVRAPGGLAHANIVGCAMFSAISGSSVATALTMGQVAVPELQKRNYHPALTTGSLAAGGTLGILIPPSIPMIIYAVTVQASIIDLFMAGVVPGIVLTLMFMVWVYIYVRRNPSHAPADPSVPALALRSVLAALADCIALIGLIGATIGSLYFGLVTPTEAGAFGALVALCIGIFYGELTWAKLNTALNRTVMTTTVVFYIIVTGALLSFAMVDAGIARGVSNAVVDAGLSPLMFFILISVLYLVLGMFIEGVSMMLLTIPVLFPSIIALGFDPVWFGVVLVVFIELGALTPPMGLNLIAIHSVAGDIPLKTIIRGSLPFAIVMVIFLAILYMVPDLALWLPRSLR